MNVYEGLCARGIVCGRLGTSSVTPLTGDGDLGVRASIKDIEAPGSNVSLKGAWKVCAESSLAASCRNGIETPLEDVRVGTSVADVDVLGCKASLKDVWKIWSETPLANVCRIGNETSLVGDGGLGAWTSIADVWRIGVETSFACVLRIGAATSLAGVGGLVTGTSVGDIWSIGAAMSLSGFWRGTETPVAWHVIITDGPSPFATDTDVPDNVKTWLGLCIKHNGSRCKSASTSSALSPSRSAS